MPKTQLHPMHGSNHPHGIDSQSLGSHGPLTQLTTQTPPVAKAVYSHSNQKPFLRKSTSLFERIITDWWWWELFSWLVSFSCLTAIIVVLFVFNGKRQPQYIIPGITLNAYIAVFSAIAKAALILPVSEAIGQLKWIWFHNRSPLSNFALFDGASRGPWASAILLVRMKCRHLACLGAAITVLALGFEPFLQQVVVFSERSTQISRAWTRAAIEWNSSDGSPSYLTRGASETPGLNPIDLSMALTVDKSLLTPNETVGDIPMACSTGNCTFDDFSTLSVCHRCEDVSYLLERICTNNATFGMDSADATGGITKPCGFQVNDTFLLGSHDTLVSSEPPAWERHSITSLSIMLVNVTGSNGFYRPFWNSTVFTEEKFPIVDLYVAYLPGGPAGRQKNSTPVMQECLFQCCSKTLKTNVEDGVSREMAVETTTIPFDGQPAGDYDPEETHFNTSDGRIFTIRNYTTQILRNRIQNDMPRTLVQDDRYPFVPSGGVWNFHHNPPYDINTVFANLTIAITNNLRSRTNGAEKVEGVAWTNVVFIEIRWAWLSLPLALLMGSLILLCATIWKSRKSRLPAWKSSALAALLHGPGEEAQRLIAANASQSEIEAISERLLVQLTARDGSGRLKFA